MDEFNNAKDSICIAPNTRGIKKGLRSIKTSNVPAPEKRLKKLYRKCLATMVLQNSFRMHQKNQKKTVLKILKHTERLYQIQNLSWKFAQLNVKLFNLNEISPPYHAYVEKLSRYNGDDISWSLFIASLDIYVYRPCSQSILQHAKKLVKNM